MINSYCLKMPETGLKRPEKKEIEENAMFYMIVLVFRHADLIAGHYLHVYAPRTQFRIKLHTA